MIILDELSFSIVDGEGFQQYSWALHPLFQMVSRKTLAKDIHIIYNHEKAQLEKLLQKVSSRIAITTDIWTLSPQNLSYICLTAHFIDEDWKLNKRVLNFVVISSHKGKDIGNVIEYCLVEWGIERLSAITVDNAIANDVAVEYLREKFDKRNNLILGGTFFHLRCHAHVMNLIVRDALNLLGPAVDLIQRTVRYIKSSPSREQHFRLCVELERIQSKRLVCLDVPTRWNATYLMLDAAINLAKAFERFEERDQQFTAEFRINKDEKINWKWGELTGLSKFLKKFYESTNVLSGALYVTSNLCFHEITAIGRLVNDVFHDKNSPLQPLTKLMNEKHDKYWLYSALRFNWIVLVAIVMDPRYKLRYVCFCYKKLHPIDVVDIIVKKVDEIMIEIFDYYQRQMTDLMSSSLSSRNQFNEDVDQSFDTSGSQETLRNEFLKHLEEEETEVQKSELRRYLDEKNEQQGLEFDILGWWKLNSVKYPTLALIAKDILAIPMSTIASESVFSTSGCVFDPHRSALTPKLVQCLICSQDWIRSSPSPSTIVETLADVSEEEELLATSG